MSFQRKRNVEIWCSRSLKVEIAFQISNFRFSLEQVARDDNYLNTTEIRASLTSSSYFRSYVDSRSKRHRKKPRGELIDISSILKVESTMSYPRRMDVILSMWIRLYNQWIIDELSPWKFDVDRVAYNNCMYLFVVSSCICVFFIQKTAQLILEKLP